LIVVRSEPSSHPPSSPTRTSARELIADKPLPVPRALLSAGVVLDDAEVEIERQRRMEALKGELTRMASEAGVGSAIDHVMALLTAMERENDRLAWRVLRANRFRFGCSTEKLSREELLQLYLAFGGDAAVAASTDDTPTDLAVPAPEPPEQSDQTSADAQPSNGESESETELPVKKKRRRVRSMQIAAHVPRVVVTVDVPDSERACALCGEEKEVFDYVEHHRIVFVPAHIEMHVERREKRGCRPCRKDVVVAPRVQTPDVVRKVDASLLAKLVNDKCALGLPLDRQRRELGRMGLDAPDKTLQSYWAYTTDLLEPIADATMARVLGSPIVGADDSHLKTLDKSRKYGTFRGRLWCFVGTDGAVAGPETVAYGYTPSWEATEIADWFSAVDGFVQCDGYAGYSREVEDNQGQSLVAVPSERRLGCGMHVRSKFHAALTAKDGRAAVALKHFADLYAIEADCKARGLDVDARNRERLARSLPILDRLDAWVDDIHPKLLPKSPLRIATTYAQNQRTFFRRCFSDGRFEIDNGRVERRIRLFAMARRAFLFTGSVRGGQRLAVAFTLVDNCLLLGIDPFCYLRDVIGKLEAAWPMRRLSELTPQRWAADKTAQKTAQ
jgi:transposase